MEQIEQEGIQPYEPPSVLPPPRESPQGNLILPLALGGAAAAVMGLLLYFVGQFLYIYILYNSVIGMVIGVAMGWGVRRFHYNDEKVLGVWAVACSLLAYAVFNYTMFRVMTAESGIMGPTFLQFLVLRAENEPLFFGIEPGKIGNFVVWFVELGITAYFALTNLMSGVARHNIDAVPREVVEFLLHEIAEGKEERDVRYGLRKRGWGDPLDQDKALEAAGAVITMIQQENEEKESEE